MKVFKMKHLLEELVFSSPLDLQQSSLHNESEYPSKFAFMPFSLLFNYSVNYAQNTILWVFQGWHLTLLLIL